MTDLFVKILTYGGLPALGMLIIFLLLKQVVKLGIFAQLDSRQTFLLIMSIIFFPIACIVLIIFIDSTRTAPPEKKEKKNEVHSESQNENPLPAYSAEQEANMHQEYIHIPLSHTRDTLILIDSVVLQPSVPKESDTQSRPKEPEKKTKQEKISFQSGRIVQYKFDKDSKDDAISMNITENGGFSFASSEGCIGRIMFEQRVEIPEYSDSFQIVINQLKRRSNKYNGTADPLVIYAYPYKIDNPKEVEMRLNELLWISRFSSSISDPFVTVERFASEIAETPTTGNVFLYFVFADSWAAVKMKITCESAELHYR